MAVTLDTFELYRHFFYDQQQTPNPYQSYSNHAMDALKYRIDQALFEEYAPELFEAYAPSKQFVEEILDDSQPFSKPVSKDSDADGNEPGVFILRSCG